MLSLKSTFKSISVWFQTAGHFDIVTGVCHSVRGTQRRFPPKYIENTFQAVQRTIRSLEMLSMWRYKICISSVVLGELSKCFRNCKGFSFIMARLVRCNWKNKLKKIVGHLLLESGIRNTAQEIWNPVNNRVQNPLKKFHWKRIRNPWRWIQNQTVLRALQAGSEYFYFLDSLVRKKNQKKKQAC